MRKIILFTSICLSSFALFACSEDDIASVSENDATSVSEKRSEISPVDISISGPDVFDKFTITVASRGNNVIINDIVVNRGNCELGFHHYYDIGDDDRRTLIKQSGVATRNGLVLDDFKFAQFLKEGTHKNTFPVTLEFAEEKKFYYYCKNKAPIIEVSVKTQNGEWTFGG